MRAASYQRFGPANEVLTVAIHERPEPGPGQVRVRITLSAINPTDVKSRSGATPRPIEGFQVPHMDGVGRIDAVGTEVDAGRIGERVWLWMAAFANPWGTAAEYSVVPAENAVPLPEATTDELGACLGVPAITAHQCLFPEGPLHGRDVLVAGGAGAVGHFAIELAHWAGARVATTVSSPEKAELARRAGADLVVNYKEDNAASVIQGWSGGIDRVVEVALVDNMALNLAVVAQGARIVTYATDGRDLQLSLQACMSSGIALRFLLLYTQPRRELRHAAEAITDALRVGALTQLPVHTFPLDRIAAAHEAVEHGAPGKVLIDLRS